MLLKDKVVLVTGAGSGMGLETAVLCAQAGARVALSGRNVDRLDAARRRIEDAGGSALVVAGDLTNEAECAAVVSQTCEAFGRLDGAFNNAGAPMHDKPVSDLSLDEWDEVMNVNLRAVFLCIKHQIRAMRRTGGGAIVNNSSIDGVMAIPHWSEYTTSKHGVVGLTRAASTEAGETGVRVNAVLPGYIVTPMSRGLLDDPSLKKDNDAALARHSVGRFGKPEDVGYAVRWLLSDEAAFVNGAMLAVDGGFTAR